MLLVQNIQVYSCVIILDEDLSYRDRKVSIETVEMSMLSYISVWISSLVVIKLCTCFEILIRVPVLVCLLTI